MTNIMIRMSSLWLLMFLLLSLQVIYCDENFLKCFNEIIEKTQSCDNKNILYVSTMGISSGLGSEFNSYLVWSLITAVFQNR